MYVVVLLRSFKKKNRVVDATYLWLYVDADSSSNTISTEF